MFCHQPVMDKACHFTISAAATYILLLSQDEMADDSVLTIGGWVFTAGVTKEIVDQLGGSSKIESLRDLAADAAGIGLSISVKKLF